MQKETGFSSIKLLLQLLILASLVGIGFAAYYAFTHQTRPVVGVIIVIAAISLWITLVKISNSSRFRGKTPGFALVFWSLTGVSIICAFSGIQPLANYKDSTFSWISEKYAEFSQPGPSPTLAVNSKNILPPTITSPATTPISSTIPAVTIQVAITTAASPTTIKLPPENGVTSPMPITNPPAIENPPAPISTLPPTTIKSTPTKTPAVTPTKTPSITPAPTLARVVKVYGTPT